MPHAPAELNATLDAIQGLSESAAIPDGDGQQAIAAGVRRSHSPARTHLAGGRRHRRSHGRRGTTSATSTSPAIGLRLGSPSIERRRVVPRLPSIPASSPRRTTRRRRTTMRCTLLHAYSSWLGVMLSLPCSLPDCSQSQPELFCESLNCVCAGFGCRAARRA